jgi:hypothetical protein
MNILKNFIKLKKFTITNKGATEVLNCLERTTTYKLLQDQIFDNLRKQLLSNINEKPLVVAQNWVLFI